MAESAFNPRVCTSKDPWCWQSKAARRLIRESFDASNNVATALAVYDALTEIASDKQSETFQTTHAWIQRMSGVSVSTIKKHLAVLVELGLVQVSTPSLRAPSTYTLLALANGRLSSANGCPTFANEAQSGALATSEESKKKYSEEYQNQTRAPVPGSPAEEFATDPDLPDRYWEKHLGPEFQCFWDGELGGVVIWDSEKWLFDHSDGPRPVPPLSAEVKSKLRARRICFDENWKPPGPFVPKSWTWAEWTREHPRLDEAWATYLGRWNPDSKTSALRCALIAAALNQGMLLRLVIPCLTDDPEDDGLSIMQACTEFLEGGSDCLQFSNGKQLPHLNQQRKDNE